MAQMSLFSAGDAMSLSLVSGQQLAFHWLSTLPRRLETIYHLQLQLVDVLSPVHIGNYRRL